MNPMNILNRIVIIIWSAVIATKTAPFIHAQETVCARVEIRIEQELTLEREGFEARLGINNGTGAELENFSVTLKFTDEAGNPVVATALKTDQPIGAKFFYGIQSGYTLRPIVVGSNPPREATGIPANTSHNVAYLIVPTDGAAKDSNGRELPAGRLYYVGAKITYTTAGQAQVVEVLPDNITVRPMPDLQLQYFLPGDVYGDDPGTRGVTEPVEPFALGVRVLNHSAYATARKLKIQSSQPEIIDNEQGLLVDFKIIGSTVNGNPTQPTLLTNFGDISPNRAAMGTWLMTASLSGKFTRFSAEVAHAPEFGGALTSLIAENPTTQRLLGQVQVDLPGRDSVSDFLATTPMTGDYSTVKVYESDSDVISVSVDYLAPGADNVSISGPTGSDQTCTLSVSTASQLLYIRATSPLSEPTTNKEVIATRSDGKVLPPSNAWLSKTKAANGAWLYWLNLFDTGVIAGQNYMITFHNPAQANRAPSLTVSGGSAFVARPDRPLVISVAATDPDGTIPSLSTASLPEGASFVDAVNGQGTLSWTPTAAQLGTYSIIFRASDGQLTTSKLAKITVAQPSAVGFDAWTADNWPGVSDPTIVGTKADPDRDGLDNLLEYALGANPNQTDDSVLPIIGVETVGDQDYLALTYRGRTDDLSLIYEVVASDTAHAPLATWTVQTTAISTDQTGAGPGFHVVKIRDSVPVAAGPTHRYLRLRITREGQP